jgi:hypothetical protein
MYIPESFLKSKKSTTTFEKIIKTGNIKSSVSYRKSCAAYQQQYQIAKQLTNSLVDTITSKLDQSINSLAVSNSNNQLVATKYQQSDWWLRWQILENCL